MQEVDEFHDESAHERWSLTWLYGLFEQAMVLVLMALMAIVIVGAVLSLVEHIVMGLVVEQNIDPLDEVVFSSLFGMVLTVIIALEFKRSILVAAERRRGVVQARTVILIGLLAMVRKLIVETGASAMTMAATAAIILSLGVVFWLIRDQDRKERQPPNSNTTP